MQHDRLWLATELLLMVSVRIEGAKVQWYLRVEGTVAGDTQTHRESGVVLNRPVKA